MGFVMIWALCVVATGSSPQASQCRRVGAFERLAWPYCSGGYSLFATKRRFRKGTPY